MPDWVENKIDVQADENDFDKVVALLTKPNIEWQSAVMRQLLVLKSVEYVDRGNDAGLRYFEFSHTVFDSSVGYYNQTVTLKSNQIDFSVIKARVDSLSADEDNNCIDFKPMKYGIWLQNSPFRGLMTDFKLVKLDVDALRKQVGIDFNNLIPMPPKACFSIEANGNQNLPQKYSDYWYDWRCKAWNTKWQPCDSSISYNQDKQVGTIEFSTAWDEPVPVLIELSKRFPDLTFDNTTSWEYDDSTRFHSYERGLVTEEQILDDGYNDDEDDDE